MKLLLLRKNQTRWKSVLAWFKPVDEQENDYAEILIWCPRSLIQNKEVTYKKFIEDQKREFIKLDSSKTIEFKVNDLVFFFQFNHEDDYERKVRVLKITKKYIYVNGTDAETKYEKEYPHRLVRSDYVGRWQLKQNPK